MKSYLLIPVILFTIKCYAQFPESYNYSAANNNIVFTDIVNDGNCGNYVYGFNKTLNQSLICNINNNGDTLWTKILDFAPYSPDSKSGHLTIGDNGIYILADKYILLPNTSHYYNVLTKLDFNGNVLWSKKIEGSLYYSNFIKAIGNNLYCVPLSPSADTLMFYKFDSNGNQIWKKGFVSNLPEFFAPAVNEIQIDSIGNLYLTGIMSKYANTTYLGNFIIVLDSSGSIVDSKRVHSVSEFYTYDGSFIDKHTTNYIVNHSPIGNKIGVRFQKVNVDSNTVYSKLFFNRNYTIIPSGFINVSENELLVTGLLYDSTNINRGFQIAVDTNFNILSAIQYSSPLDSLNISLYKTTYDCNTFTTVGSIANSQRSAGYIIKKENINDNICFQSNLPLTDSLVFDTIENLPLAQYTTTSWQSINSTTAHLAITKNYCSFFDAVQKLSIDNKQLILFPNPAKEMITISAINPNTQIIITDFAGQLVKQTTVNNGQELDISNLTSGLYFIKAQTKNTIQVAKFIKQ